LFDVDEGDPRVDPESIRLAACYDHFDALCEEGIRLVMAMRAASKGQFELAQRLRDGRIVAMGIKDGQQL
jgi:hypothetical protein